MVATSSIIMNEAVLVTKAIQYITNELTEGLQSHRLPEVLAKFNLAERFCSTITGKSNVDIFGSSGKILVIGEPACKVKDIRGIFKSFGLVDRLEYYLDYDSIQGYNFNRLRNNSKYSLIIVGPMPHSTQGAGDYSSVIARMEDSDEFPSVVRATANGRLKITKSNLKQILQNALDCGSLAA